MRAVFLLLALGVSCAHGVAVQANPIRKIVTLMQDMQKEIEAEGEKEKVSGSSLVLAAQLFPRNRRGGVLVRLLTGSRLRNQSFWVSPPRSPLPAARIDRSRRGEANEAPGPDQLLDLGKSIFLILRGADTPTQRPYTWGTWDVVFCGRSSSPRSPLQILPSNYNKTKIDQPRELHTPTWDFGVLDIQHLV